VRHHPLLLLCLAGCADDLAAPQDGADAAPSRIATTTAADGSRTTRVEATSESDWVYLDLDAAREVDAAGAWELGFRRFEVTLAGGLAYEDGASFEGMTAAPGGDYATDAAAFAAGEGWYSYDPTTHELAPRDRVYVVRSVAGAHWKLRFTSYYDDAGTSGHPTFRWAAVAAPGGSP
jgi:hypothetical protein